MLLLGIDTSGKNACAAVYDTQKEMFSARISVFTKMTHSQVIMPMCTEVLKKASLELKDIGRIAVAMGPGSYTGLRIGVAAVQALTFGLECECCGVSTLEAMAYGNISYKGLICPIMTARKDLVYTAVYECDGRCLSAVGIEKIISHDELAIELAGYEREALLCGDGCGEFFTDYQSAMFRIAPPHLRMQSAEGVCLAAAVKEPQDPQDLRVSYLQKVKAEKDLDIRNT